MKKYYSLLILLVFEVSAYSQTKRTIPEIRIYDHNMDPRMHPDYNRYKVQPPDITLFNNKMQFMALRKLDGDYVSKINEYVDKYELGNIIWPAYTLLYQKELPDIVKEIKKRGLYLFDLWGYVPGSGPGGYWQQFKVPQKALDLFERELGDKWLGMDNGEQDGRYIGGYATQLYPRSTDREEQYLNFQNHFQGLCDRLGNKMATLVSLNYGHYFLKEGVYTLIGAETAQGLPNTQIYYSFIRGAGKQYGVHWFGNASVWNRWGWKNYERKIDYNGGDTKGTSLSLLKRLIYSHIMYDCVAAGFESSFFDDKGNLSPIGEIQRSAVRWVNAHGDPGVMYTPVALMVDFFSGWTFPRHLYSKEVYKVWGNLPFDKGDYFTNNVLNMLYPGYQDASYFHDETGFITPTPYGDIADVLLSDAPSWILQQYSVIIIAGSIKGNAEIKDKLLNYLQQGGHLIITAGSLKQLPEGLVGVTAGKDVKIERGNEVVFKDGTEYEGSSFILKELSFPEGAETVARIGDFTAIITVNEGHGKLSVFASPFGLYDKPACELPVKSEIDKPLENPYPMLNHVTHYLNDVFNKTRIFKANEELSLITCRKDKGEYTVAVCNNSWQEKPFSFSSDNGKILKVEEFKIDNSERKAVGFLPESVKQGVGKNTKTKIAGGDIRIFRIKMKEEDIETIPIVHPPARPINRGVALRDINSVKKEILLRPTFFQNFDRVMVDWKYFDQKDMVSLKRESGWISRQKLKIIGDFSSGINLFPNLRLVNNDSIEYNKSIERIFRVIDKMALLNVDDIVITSHRMIENNFTKKQFDISLIETLKNISKYAGEKKMTVNFKVVPKKFPYDIDYVEQLYRSVNESNFKIAFPASVLLSLSDEMNERLVGLSNHLMFVDASVRDKMNDNTWNDNSPVYIISDIQKEKLRKILKTNSGAIFVLDAQYKNKDEEYLDIRTLNELINIK